MSDYNKKNFADFRKLVEPWWGAYQCVVKSYVALKSVDGPRLLFGRILLEPSRDGIDDASFVFETEHVIAGRFVTNAADCECSALLENGEVGELVCEDGTTVIELEMDSALSTSFSPIYHPLVSSGARLPSLTVRGTSRHNLIVKVSESRQLDWELKAATTPFDSLDDLLDRCGLPIGTQMGDSATLEIVAKSPAMISATSTIANGEAVIECHLAAGLDPALLLLGYKLFGQGRVDRGSAGGANIQWRDENDIKVGSCRIPVGEVSVLLAFVSFGGVSLHQGWISDPSKHLNPRHAIHKVFDEDFEVLKKMLSRPDPDNKYGFENAVSTLLSLLGFSAINYGRMPKLQRGPDIIAITPAGHVAVVECTIGLLDQNDKLAKLVQRIKLVREKLIDSGYGHLQIHPVIVTPLTRAEVSADLDDAGKHGIAVICKENIEEMLNQASLPPHADRLFEDAKDLIPASGQQSLFRE